MPTLSRRALQELRDFVEHVRRDAFSEIWRRDAERMLPLVDRALAGSRSARMSRQRTAVKREAKKTDRRTGVQTIRPRVEARAAGACECGCGGPLDTGYWANKAEWDEFWGRGRIDDPKGLAKPERVPPTFENTWMLRRECHDAKTNERPSRRAWLERFRGHCIRHGYMGDAAKAGYELGKLDDDAALDAAANRMGPE